MTEDSGDKVPPSGEAATRYQEQLDRARSWQTKRLRAIADRIEAGGFVEAKQADIDAIFRK